MARKTPHPLAVFSDGTSTDASDFDSSDIGGSPRGSGSPHTTLAGNTLGVTLDGMRVFVVPPLMDHLDCLFFRWNSAPALMTWAGFILSAYLASQSHWRVFLLVTAVFWRLMVNVGIGAILTKESKENALQQWIFSVRELPNSRLNAFVGRVLSSVVPDRRDILNDLGLPVSLPAWVSFRIFVNVVEFNEVVAFTLLALRHGFAERGEAGSVFFGFASPLMDVVGAALACLSLYGKYSALRVAGDYGWYWGDFFFLRTGTAMLSFDGVFELFPHPMYTIGYGWTYGCAILARSSTVLAVSMAFHLSQLLFLMLVEEPHIKKQQEVGIGGTTSARKRKLASATSGVAAAKPAPKGSNVFLLKNFDIFRASDVMLLLMCIFFVGFMWVGSFPGGPLDSDGIFVGMASWWTGVANVVKSVILLRQARSRFWTRHFVRNGQTRRDAFAAWRRLFNMLQCLQYLSFFLCAWRLFWMPPTWSACARPEYITRLIWGTMLIMVSNWSFQQCYEALGDYGWFYGDFFIPPTAKTAAKELKKQASRKERRSLWKSLHGGPKGKGRKKGIYTLGGGGEEGEDTELEVPQIEAADEGSDTPTYEGIYRYLNNPDAYLGHMWMYGMSLICSSPQLLTVAVLSHAMKILFLQVVEKPHCKMVYKQHLRKSGSAIGHAVSKKVRKIKETDTAMFLANWFKHPIETGALAPSSRHLARAMCDTMHLGQGSVVVELGPGTGPFTREIFQRQSAYRDTSYLAFELSEEFVARLRQLYPEHKDDFLIESAENIRGALKKRGIDHCDTVISGLPWAIFPAALQEGILQEVNKALKPGGRFCTFAYLQGLLMPAGQRFKKLLEKTFVNVERSPIVWKNLPPAFVYRCEKKTMPSPSSLILENDEDRDDKEKGKRD